MESGAIFYDMDSAWHSKQKRSKLLPAIRNKGLKLAVYLYDIIQSLICHPLENVQQFPEQHVVYPSKILPALN